MLAVVSHDAGGAEILSSYVLQQKIDCFYVLGEPARQIFQRKLDGVNTLPLDKAVSQATSILCGTSWQSDLEYKAIKLARKLGKPSVSFLDHWVNYRERFTRSGELYVPDAIWVGDSMAEKLVKTVFPSHPIRLVENPYFYEIRQELSANALGSNSDVINVLYVCEPIREHALQQHGDEYYWGYVEEDALRFFLSNLSLLSNSVASIKIRLHPSEAIKKYNWVLSEFDLPIEICSDQTLIKQISSSVIVAGCESMAMVVALLAGKRVISSIPPGGRPCVLPHLEIEKLQDILK